jgi:ribonuclease R
MTIEPLPRREAILALLSSRSRPLRASEIAARLDVSERSFPGFLRFLESLAHEGVLRALPDDRFGLEGTANGPRARTEREGNLSVNARGFGFVRSIGHEDDLFIPEDRMGGALHGDTVSARFVKRTTSGSEGEIVRILKRANARIAGTLRRKGKSAWLEPDDSRVRGPLVITGTISGQDGEAAVVAITRYPMLPDENPECEIVKVLGTPGDPQVEVAKILVREAVDEGHPPEAVAEAEAYGSVVAEADLVGREDFTGVPLPTIDPDDARDHDDAVWVQRNDDGTYTAWIAIADVSHYVRPETALDAAALARSCSIYLPTRAIPMLPRALSSNLCSLLPDVIRLCLCLVVQLDAGANVTDYRVAEGFMKSRAKLTYGGVARALGFTDKPPVQEAAEAMVEDLRVADTLSQMLRTKRLRRGALDFTVPEPKIVLDKETEAPIGVEKRSEDPGMVRAYQLIEELMLLANELVAKFLVDRTLPAIFRVHAAPDETKLERFATFAEDIGLVFDIDDARDPKKLSMFLKKMSKHPRADVLSMLLLRAMKQAVYDTANIGHFGLASTAYLHFTSPIRRYPDLVVHRIVRRSLRNEPIDVSDAGKEKLAEAALTASKQERHAMEVEREVVDLYRTLYMRAFIGDTFEGMVTGVVGGGAFVTLDSPFVEVLVRPDAMGKDIYTLDDEAMKFVAKRSGDTVAIGDRMTVTIEDVQIIRRTVYAWRTAPGYADSEPLRQSPFSDGSGPPSRSKRRGGNVPPPRKSVQPQPHPRRGPSPKRKKGK